MVNSQLLSKSFERFQSALDYPYEETKPKESFDRSHIFFAIMNYLVKKTVMEEKMDLTYHFYNYNSALKEMRDDALDAGKFILDHTMEMRPLNFELDEIHYGINTLYYPALSYYYYKRKEYEVADINLEKAIKYIYLLKDEPIEEISLALLEQLINKVKIYASWGKTDDTIEYGAQLINAVMNGEPNSFVKVFLKDKFKSKEDWKDYVQYITDNVLFKLISLSKDAIFFPESDILSISEHLLKGLEKTDTQFQEIKSAFQGLVYFYKGEYDEFLNLFESGCPLNADVPTSIQYLNVLQLFHVYDQLGYNYKVDEELNRKAKRFFEKIELPYFFRENFTLNPLGMVAYT